MADYRLKHGQENIRVVDGAFAGRIYRSGVVYAEIPPEEASRFEKIAEQKKKKNPAALAGSEVIEDEKL